MRQEILATLGRLDVLEQSGQLDSLLRSGLRFCKKIKVLDAHAAGETQPVSIRKIGPDLVFGRLWKSMGFAEIVRDLAGKRRHEFDLERAVYLTVLHRLFVSGSHRAAEAWKENYHIPGTEEIYYVIGVRMRRTKEVGEVVLKSRKPWKTVTPERVRVKDPAPLKVKEVEVEGRRYVICLNEEEKRKDACDRAAIVESLGVTLKSGDKSLVGNKGFRRFLKTEGKSHFAIDEKKIIADERYDGLFVLRTDTGHDAETIANDYKTLWMVEDTFRTAKSILETRPIYHKCDATIRGHVFCSFLALCLKRELELRLEEKGLDAEWAEIIRGLDNLQQVELLLQGSRFLLRSEIKGHASQAIRAAEVAMPPVLQDDKGYNVGKILNASTIDILMHAPAEQGRNVTCDFIRFFDLVGGEEIHCGAPLACQTGVLRFWKSQAAF